MRTVVSSPHIRASRGVPAIMTQVIVALIPAFGLYVWLFGFGVVVHLVIAIVCAVVLEAFALRLRGIEPSPSLRDWSVVVLACLIVLAIPPYAPWWITVCGVSFAVVIVKHAFGGLGHNIFNPAMVGYIFLLLSFPSTMSHWPVVGTVTAYLGPWDAVQQVFFGSQSALDGLSGATVLDQIKTQSALMRMQSEIPKVGFGILGGRGWEWVNVAYLLGGCWLLWQKVITWRLPLSFIAGLAIAASIGYISDPELHRGAIFHLFSGGALLAAFFVVTDPVSSATTPRGMLIFGAATGVLTYFVREFGSFPDGVAFAVVTMNGFAPLIDRITQPRLYGSAKKLE